MKRWLLACTLVGLLFPGLSRIEAQDTNAPSAPVISTATSHDYPQVTCTGSDALACADTLQLASEARNQLAPILGLGPVWRFPVHIHIITPDDPLAAKINREASAAFATDTTMKIEAVLPSDDPDAREFIQRQFITALLYEKFFATTQTFDKNTKLDAVPVWLIEGLREWINEDPEHDREGIVRKSVQDKRTPTLAEMNAWKSVSHDRLLGLWQRAFCFYLVDSLINTQDRRDHFHRWLDTLAGPNPELASRHFPTEESWQRELVLTAERHREIVYSWDATAAELSSAEVIAIPTDKPDDTHICTLETVTTFPKDQKLVDALHQKIIDLTNLELRAHVSWRPIIALYRFGLTALVNDPKPDNAIKLIRQAHDQRAAEIDNHQKLVDYLNWFEVTKDYSSNASRFRTYFSTAAETENAEADPKHPNPIRADLLLIESEL